MRRSLRLLPVLLMGALAIAYVLARPLLAARVPHLAIFEFPVGALIVALLVWAALARRRPEAVPVEWRKHEQVVRALPDPALAPYESALARWVETGEGTDAAADVIARAGTTDPVEREALRARVHGEISVKASRRKRETLLKKYIGA